MVKYFCEKCRYRFIPKNPKKGIPKVCPYCGRAGTVCEEESADSLVKNVDDMIDQ
jgi:hypothetical protein